VTEKDEDQKTSHAKMQSAALLARNEERFLGCASRSSLDREQRLLEMTEKSGGNGKQCAAFGFGAVQLKW